MSICLLKCACLSLTPEPRLALILDEDETHLIDLVLLRFQSAVARRRKRLFDGNLFIRW